MTSLVRNAVCGLMAVTTGEFALWIHHRAKFVEKEHRGSLSSRIIETAHAAIASRKFSDKPRAQQHVELVSSLSSKKYAESNPRRLIQELDKLATSYFAGYLFETTSTVSGRQPFVFRYHENLPVLLPKINNIPYKGFSFAGLASQLYDNEAREQILQGNYIRCQPNLPYKNHEKKTYEKMEAIITGTIDCKKCSAFKTDFMKDVVMAAAGMDGEGSIEPSYPLSDTPVFEIDKDQLKEVGDLADFPKSTKKIVSLGAFTFCHFYALQKTRLSQSSYKELGAVIAGVENPKICEALHFGHMRELLASLKKEK